MDKKQSQQSQQSILDETNESIRCFLRLKSVPCKRMGLIILSKFASRVERAWMQSETETETGVYFITKSRLLKCVARKCKLFCQSDVHYHYGRQEEPAILISRLLSRMCRMHVASIRLDFH